MSTFLEMPFLARLYISAVALMGAAAAVYGISHSGVENSIQFAVYLFVAVLASALKVNLPTITGTMSVNSLFILISIVQLKQGEAMVIAIVGVLIQCLWKPKSRVLPVRVLFSAAANALAVSASYYVFDQPFLSHDLDGIRVLATACAYFIVNTALVALIVAITERKPVTKVWTECYFWCFPYYMGGAVVAWLSTVLKHRFDWQVSFALLPVVYFIYRSYKLYLQRLEDEKKHVEEMAGLHLRTIEALALAIEAKDHTTHDHLRRVRVYALELGARMGLSDLDLQSLRAAALLHDIGKLAVPEYIISKPGKLTQEEFERMKIHPVVGAQILEQVKFPYPVAPIVMSHHEKWDGSGYPHGLKGSEIPLGARILSAVDCLDALASDRQYRRALPLDKAMEIVAGESGIAFDPAVVSLLQSCYVELEHKALAQPHTAVRIDTEMVISRGAAPATGFEQDGGLTEVTVTIPEKELEPLLAAARAREAAHDLHEWSRSLEQSSGASSLRLPEMLAVYAARLKTLVKHDALVFYLRRDNHLVPEFVSGQNKKLFSSLRIPWGEGLSGWVAENRKPMLNGNPSVEAGYLNDPSKFSTLCSALAVPLETASGVNGVLTLYRTERDAFSATDLRTLTAASSRIALALERSTDGEAPGTVNEGAVKLPGVRSLFLRIQQELDRAASRNGSFTLILIDLDRFADINHRFGHQTGDRILSHFSKGLCDLFPAPAYVTHMGGDEFAVLLPDAAPDAVTHALESIRFAVNLAGRQKPESLALTHTVGVAHYSSGKSDPESLLTEAETRLHKGKLAKRVAPQIPADSSLRAVPILTGITAAS
jgi:diguanylate cyclase (GGDEF)-like protein/putative nucleotidyltransferase with HDIG domain